jgi:hypothetical protein
MQRRIGILLLALTTVGGCSQYRLASLDDVELPSYEPRPVIMPASCDSLIARVAAVGMQRVTEVESREALFCQQQQIIRAQEEEAASKRLEAHAEAARFVFTVATTVITGLIATLAFIF